MVDVLTISDFRLPGGTSHSNAEEIQAQYRLGLSSDMVHLNGGLSAAARGLNPRLEHLIRKGEARFVPTPTPRAAPVAVARHPAMITSGGDQLGPVEVDHLIVVVNATPVDWLGREHWRPEEVHPKAAELFGVEPLWAPIGPNVREAIKDRVPAGRLRVEDWVNIIDVDHWWVDRSGRSRDRRPIVGRHSRASVQKWPLQPDRDVIYPSDGRWDIRVLGWDPVVEDALGPPPSTWSVHRFGTIAPRSFLADLDFFVYFHHPDLIEAFGRTILEAIASGVPAILPHHFEPLFGASALYAEPDSVADVVEGLWADPEAYHAHVLLAETLVRHRFSYQAHGRRLAELLPEGRTGELRTAPRTSGARAARSPRGAGGTVVLDLAPHELDRSRVEQVLGDTRCVAALTIDPALAERVDWCDVVPTAADCSLPEEEWTAMVARRAVSLLAAHPDASVVLLDTHPLDPVLEQALAERAEVRRPERLHGPAEVG